MNFCAPSAGSNEVGNQISRIQKRPYIRGGTVNKALARKSRKSGKIFADINFLPLVDHSTIRNTWPAMVGCRICIRRIRTGGAMDDYEPVERAQETCRGTAVKRSAKIIVPRRSPVIHCTVQNITSGGACLKLAHSSRISFDLTFECGSTRRACRVAWRTADKLWRRVSGRGNSGGDGERGSGRDQSRSIARARASSSRLSAGATSDHKRRDCQ